MSTLLLTLLLLNVLIFVHESGHFWAARLCRVDVLRFSVGFGPRLWGWRGRDGTEYVLAAIPLGGYIKMLDARAEAVPEERLPRAMQSRPLVQRMFVVAAGPAANFLLALVLLWGLLLVGGERGVVPLIGAVAESSQAQHAGLQEGQRIVALNGKPVTTVRDVQRGFLRRLGEEEAWEFSVRDAQGELSRHLLRWHPEGAAGEQRFLENPLGALGISLYYPPIAPVVGAVTPGSRAEQAGLRAGDRILASDGVPLAEWSQWARQIRSRPEQEILLSVERQGRELLLRARPGLVTRQDQEIGFLGVSPEAPPWPEELLVEKRYSWVGSLGGALASTWDNSLLILNFLWKMALGKVSSRHLGGPVAIAEGTGSSAAVGFGALLAFAALLSINLGVLNLLPIPILDGGMLLLYALEGVRGRPLGQRAEQLFLSLGLALLGLVIARALYNDLLRLLGVFG